MVFGVCGMLRILFLAFYVCWVAACIGLGRVAHKHGVVGHGPLSHLAAWIFLLFGCLDRYMAAGVWCAMHLGTSVLCAPSTGLQSWGCLYFEFGNCVDQYNSLLLAAAKMIYVPSRTAPCGPSCGVCAYLAIFCPYYCLCSTSCTLTRKHCHCKRVNLLGATSLCQYYHP